MPPTCSPHGGETVRVARCQRWMFSDGRHLPFARGDLFPMSAVFLPLQSFPFLPPPRHLPFQTGFNLLQIALAKRGVYVTGEPAPHCSPLPALGSCCRVSSEEMGVGCRHEIPSHPTRGDPPDQAAGARLKNNHKPSSGEAVLMSSPRVVRKPHPGRGRTGYRGCLSDPELC